MMNFIVNGSTFISLSLTALKLLNYIRKLTKTLYIFHFSTKNGNKTSISIINETIGKAPNKIIILLQLFIFSLYLHLEL